jgi:hypothetical protein
MIDLQKIKSLGVSSNLIEFTEFLIEEKGDKTFPDYRTLDLMKIPKLVPYIWVIDFRNGIDDGMLFHFQEHRLMPTMVTTLQDIFLKIVIPENILMKCSMVVTDRSTYRKKSDIIPGKTFTEPTKM